MSLLTIKDLCVYYQRPGQPRRDVLHGITVNLDSGQSLGIVGSSGCGKTTLARAIVGLQPASAGNIVFDGVDLLDRQLNRTAIAQKQQQIQMVFQDATGSLNPRRTVHSALTEAIRSHERITGEHLNKRVLELLELVGLPASVADVYPNELSGGQCQRVSIARALSVQPRILVADEPVSALDVSIQARILNLLRELQQKIGLSLILISHDLAVVTAVCDTILVMSDGKIVEYGPTEKVIKNPVHPCTQLLLETTMDSSFL